MLRASGDGFSVVVGGETLLVHRAAAPLLEVGCGDEQIDMHMGHFRFRDGCTGRKPLRHTDIRGDRVAFSETADGPVLLTLSFEFTESGCTATFADAAEGLSRFWIHLPSAADEGIYGCGVQYSYLNLKGRNYPLWVSEPGVGRDKRTLITKAADKLMGAGGDYYNTYFPQPTYVTDGLKLVHLDCSAYMEFDFSAAERTTLYSWAMPASLRIERATDHRDLSRRVSALFGKQPELPDWIHSGVLLGVQGGTDAVLKKLAFAEQNGVPVSAVWSQDWQGKRVTSLGKRLFWNWAWNEAEYPGLDRVIKELAARGIRYLGYINPYLCVDGALYAEGEQNGYFVQNRAGKPYLIDFGQFTCGSVDFTNPAAFEWYKDIIKKNMIAFGLSGWMADFGEYLPADAVLASGEDPKLLHNRWPVLWARLNREAIEESGRGGDIVFFMRSGFTGAQRFCPLLWAGDQSVNFSRHDGLISTVPAALSAGLCGNGLSHSDIGGFTGFNKLLVRGKKVFLRWTELAAFTPVMRTHEGILPDQNHQYYDSADTAAFLAKMTRIHVGLAPYLKAVIVENARDGVPVMRPLFYHYDDRALADCFDEFLLGPDLLVAPVWKRFANARTVTLPDDEWIHLFTGKAYGGGTHRVRAPLGRPPVFYRKGSPDAALFRNAVQ